MADFYNSERKEAFLKTVKESNRTYYRQIFKAVKEDELLYSCDLCELNENRFEAFIDCFGHFKKSTLSQKKTLIGTYIDWCREQGYCRVNAIRVVTLKQLEELLTDKIEERYYLDPEEYEESIKKLMEDQDGLYLSSIFMSVYEGISGANFVNLIHLRLRDLEGNRAYLYDGRTKSVTLRLVKLLQEMGEETTFMNHSNTRSNYTCALHHDSIWKAKKESDCSGPNRFNYAFRKMKKILNNNNVTVSAVEQSGLFFRIAQGAKRQGFDLKTDMELEETARKLGTLSYKYGDILRDAGTYMKFSEFKSRFRGWIKYLK